MEIDELEELSMEALSQIKNGDILLSYIGLLCQDKEKTDSENVMEKKKVLITGASRGIGKAIAIEFAKKGYDIYVTCKNSFPELQRLCNELEANYNIKATAFLADAGNAESADKLFADIQDIDVVVNNAGISYIGLLTDMSVKEWNSVIDTNFNSLFYVCRHAVPLMVSKKSGKIINISSVWGNVGASMEVAYSAAKGGMNAFTKALAKELAPSNIQVNAIACGVIDTQMNQYFSEEEKEALREEIPADRFGKPEEVAGLVLQLAEGNTYLTGQIIALDGGWN